MEEKVFLNWKWVDDQIAKIDQQVTENGEDIIGVTGIPRGGLIPAIIYSHRSGLPFLEYTEAANCPTMVRRRILCLDDIADSGRTLEEIESLEFITATLAYRDHSAAEPDYYGERIEHKAWLSYPWENENAQTVQDYLVE